MSLRPSDDYPRLAISGWEDGSCERAERAGSDDPNSRWNCACCTVLALLPAIIQGALWLAAIGFVLAVAIGAGGGGFAGAQSSEGLGIELIVAGVFLVWLHYENKARREVAAEEAAKLQQQLQEQLGSTES